MVNGRVPEEGGIVSQLSPIELSPVELVALAGAVKTAAEAKAKAGLPDGFSEPVDFTVRVQGIVQKGQGTPAAEFEKPPIVNLRGIGVVCAVFRQLGIGPKRLASALAALPPTDHLASSVDAELEGVFAAAESLRAESLPAVKGTTPAKAGSVQTTVTVTRVE